MNIEKIFKKYLREISLSCIFKMRFSPEAEPFRWLDWIPVFGLATTPTQRRAILAFWFL